MIIMYLVCMCVCVCAHYYINIFAEKCPVMHILETTKPMKGVYGGCGGEPPPPQLGNNQVNEVR